MLLILWLLNAEKNPATKVGVSSSCCGHLHGQENGSLCIWHNCRLTLGSKILCEKQINFEQVRKGKPLVISPSSSKNKHFTDWRGCFSVTSEPFSAFSLFDRIIYMFHCSEQNHLAGNPAKSFFNFCKCLQPVRDLLSKHFHSFAPHQKKKRWNLISDFLPVLFPLIGFLQNCNFLGQMPKVFLVQMFNNYPWTISPMNIFISIWGSWKWNKNTPEGEQQVQKCVL